MRRQFISALLAVIAFPAAARADDAKPPAISTAAPIKLGAEITVDLTNIVSGGGDHRARLLSNIDLLADADLNALIGWKSARAYVHVLDNRGARPNDAARTLQGVDNIEVAQAGLRLFEAWIEQDFGGPANLRAGLYDLNDEFYTNPAAGMLIAPPFGIGSELAATGPNGPSIFPSSALAMRLRIPLAKQGGYLQFAAVNARAGTLGDPDGIDFSFRDGLLLIGEGGMAQGSVRGSLGAWRYTRNPAQFAPPDRPPRAALQGAYVVLEADVMPSGPRQLTAFLRAGRSDPYSSAFAGGLQTGLTLSPAFTARPNSAVALGLHHAWTTRDFKIAQRAAGNVPAGGEAAIELSYSDQLVDGITLQPDVQWVHQPGGLATAPDTILLTLRTKFAF